MSKLTTEQNRSKSVESYRKHAELNENRSATYFVDLMADLQKSFTWDECEVLI